MTLLPSFSTEALDGARWVLAMGFLADGNPTNQQRLVELELPEAALKVEPPARLDLMVVGKGGPGSEGCEARALTLAWMLSAAEGGFPRR